MIVAILQARISSTRLPGKVLKNIIGHPMLGLQLQRVQASKKIDKIVVATSLSPSDDPIEELAQQYGVECYRGDLHDVLDRYYQAAKKFSADHVVRITGDCPVIDPRLIDELICRYIESDIDYLCNTQKPTFPDGQDIWVFSFKALEKAWHDAILPSEREHVVMFIKNHPELFKISSFEDKHDYSHLRWTVDEEKDFELIVQFFKNLYPDNNLFSVKDILEFLELRPELKTYNTSFKRDEGLTRSIEEDDVWLKHKNGNSIHQSLDLQNRGKKAIAGMNHLLSKRPDQFSTGVWPAYYSKASGVKVWDMDDNCYIDMSIGGIGATVLGYADEDVNRAVSKALVNGVGSSLNCPEEVELAELLCEHHPWAEQARFARTGGEAMSVAIRIARGKSRKDKIAFCGYHGWHDWYLAANLGEDHALDGHLLPGLSPKGVPRALAGTTFPFRYNHLEDLEAIVKKHSDEIGVIVMEPIRNEAPDDGFLSSVKAIANKINAILVFDEISAGYRLNNGGSHLRFGVNPDIAVFSKAIGNGHAIAALIGKTSVMEVAQDSFISSTCWSERIGPVAALATIKKFVKEDVSTHLNEMGQMVQDGWLDISLKHNVPLDIGGILPLSHFTFVGENHLELKAYFIQEMLDRGFLASNIFYAMFSHRPWHVKAYMEAASEVFQQISGFHSKAEIIAKLRGKPASSGFKRLI